MPITTLSWSDGIAYGPRGTRYQVLQVGGLYECRVYSPEGPDGGESLTRAEGTREGAMLAAQRHVNALTTLVGAESDAIAGAGRTQLNRSTQSPV